MFEFLQQLYANALASHFAGDVAANLSSAAIGGLIVTIFGLLIKRRRDRKINKMFPVSGMYNTSYEDLIKGQTVSIKSISTINQKGRTIFGSTKTNEGRVWNLEGTILNFGHIYGSYKPADLSDQGIGSFYLRLKGDDLDGMWGGYDSENNRISSGKYYFRRISKVDVVPFEEVHKGSVIEIAHREFGAGYFDKVFLDQGGPNNEFLVAIENGAVRGFAAGRIVEKDQLSNILKGESFILPRNVQHYYQHGKLALLQSVAVDHRFQGRGIGRQLITALQERFRCTGAEAVLVLAWKNGERVNAGSVLESLGYESSGVIEKFWKDSCDAKRFICPDKVDHQCVCAVKVYIKTNLSGNSRRRRLLPKIRTFQTKH